jgi:hypothetical protein
MDRRIRSSALSLCVVTFGFVLMPGRAMAQFGLVGGPPSGGATGASGAPVSPYGGTAWPGMAMNPFMNPYANPYLNPVATQTNTPMSAGTAALYFLAAQQANGGIGSGRLGGPQGLSQPGATARTGRAGAGSRAPGSSPTDAQRLSGSNTPGAGASRYFNRDYQANQSASRYYSRQTRHFPTPGK